MEKKKGLVFPVYSDATGAPEDLPQVVDVQLQNGLPFCQVFMYKNMALTALWNVGNVVG